MPALDTNVLVRYLVAAEVADDASQHAAARQLVADSIRQGQTLFVPITVLLELEWVLRASYGFDKRSVLATISALASAAELTLESERAIEVALQLYREGSADFADGLHVALAAQAGEQPLWTFDKRAARVEGARLLAKA